MIAPDSGDTPSAEQSSDTLSVIEGQAWYRRQIAVHSIVQNILCSWRCCNRSQIMAAERAEALNELGKSCPAVGKRLGLERAQEENPLSEPSNRSNSIRTSIEYPTISQVERVPQQVF